MVDNIPMELSKVKILNTLCISTIVCTSFESVLNNVLMNIIRSKITETAHCENTTVVPNTTGNVTSRLCGHLQWLCGQLYTTRPLEIVLILIVIEIFRGSVLILSGTSSFALVMKLFPQLFSLRGQYDAKTYDDGCQCHCSTVLMMMAVLVYVYA